MNIIGNFLLCVSLNYYIKLSIYGCMYIVKQKKRKEKFDKIIIKNNGEKMKEERVF